MNRRLVLLMICLSTITLSMAQSNDSRHEVRLSGGIYPFKAGRSFWLLEPAPDTGSTQDRYQQAATRWGGTFTTGTYSVEYTCHLGQRLAIGGAVSYVGAYCNLFSNRDASTQGRIFRHYISLMPQFRYTWYESRLVRLYSLASAGVTLVTGYDRDLTNKAFFAFQLSPIGIAVGRRLFGFAEAGIGAQGSARIGLGYKFGDKR